MKKNDKHLDTNYRYIIEEKVEDIYGECVEVSRFLFDNPEVGGQEKKAAEYLGKTLEKHGFNVKFPYGDLSPEKLEEIGMPPGETLETAFVAEVGTSDFEHTVAFLAEYDALAGYGPKGEPAHACGHNWIAATMVGCGIALAEVAKVAEELKLRVMVIGTPAEETYGAKVNMAKLGAFDGVNLIFQAHLSDKFAMEVPTLAMYSVEFDFHGRAAHAAINPEQGINALEGVISMFNSINGLRQHVGRDAIVHGIITNGGQASNVIPEFAQCQFEIREKTRAKLDVLRKRVIDTAKAAALATGTTMEYRDYENHNDNLVNLKSMTEVCKEYFRKEGITEFVAAEDYIGAGSTDLGNVSYICPTLYAEVKLANGQSGSHDSHDGSQVHVHQQSALDQVASDGAHEMMKKIMRIFPLTAVEIVNNKEILDNINEEFRRKACLE